MNHIYNHRELALAYHRRLPERIRTYLMSLGISNSIICRYRIGWDGSRVTIPITDRDRVVRYFRLLRDPEADASGPEFTSWPEARPELYGWERVMSRREGVVVCFGEVSRLILESHGIASLSIPEQCPSLPNEWTRLLSQIPTLYLYLNPAQTTATTLVSLAADLPHARLISSDALGESGVSGFFVGQRKTLEDFEVLCSLAPRLDGRSITEEGHD